MPAATHCTLSFCDRELLKRGYLVRRVSENELVVLRASVDAIIDPVSLADEMTLMFSEGKVSFRLRYWKLPQILVHGGVLAVFFLHFPFSTFSGLQNWSLGLIGAQIFAFCFQSYGFLRIQFDLERVLKQSSG